MKKNFQKIKDKFKKKSPDWIFAIVQMIYWIANRQHSFIKLLPSRDGFWTAESDGERIFIPSPRISILAHFTDSYEKVYEKYFKVKENDIVLDAGAYIGSFTIKASKRAKKVLAIEPDPRSYACLEKNIVGLSNVRSIKTCLWNRSQKMKLYVDSKYPIANSLVIPPGEKFVYAISDTIDNIALKEGIKRIDFIKINVEGAEMEVLQGGAGILRTAKKVVIDAHHNRDGKETWPQVCQVLETNGFKILAENGTVYAWKA